MSEANRLFEIQHFMNCTDEGLHLNGYIEPISFKLKNSESYWYSLNEN